KSSCHVTGDARRVVDLADLPSLQQVSHPAAQRRSRDLRSIGDHHITMPLEQSPLLRQRLNERHVLARDRRQWLGQFFGAGSDATQMTLEVDWFGAHQDLEGGRLGVEELCAPGKHFLLFSIISGGQRAWTCWRSRRALHCSVL